MSYTERKMSDRAKCLIMHVWLVLCTSRQVRKSVMWYISMATAQQRVKEGVGIKQFPLEGHVHTD